MKLNEIELQPRSDFNDTVGRLVNEQTDRGDRLGNDFTDLLRLIEIDRTRAGRIEIQTDRIDSDPHRVSRILDPSNATYFHVKR